MSEFFDHWLSKEERLSLGRKHEQMYYLLTTESQKKFKAVETKRKELIKIVNPMTDFSMMPEPVKTDSQIGIRSARRQLVESLRAQDLFNNGGFETLADLKPEDGLRVRGSARIGKDKVNPEVFEQDDTWKYNSNSIICIINKENINKASKLITKGFQQFTYFDDPAVEVETKINAHGQGNANFNPDSTQFKIFAFNDVLGKIGGVSTTHNVTLFGKDPKGINDYDQIALTNGLHGLVGIRRWGHTVLNREDLLKSRKYHKIMDRFSISDEINLRLSNIHQHDAFVAIVIWTEAYETFNNAAGLGGAEYNINEDGKELWRNYLQNVVKAVTAELKKESNTVTHFGETRQDKNDIGYWEQLNPLEHSRRYDFKSPFNEKRFEVFSDYGLEFQHESFYEKLHQTLEGAANDAEKISKSLKQSK